MYEHFPHEADMGVRGIGASQEAAFAEAARALVALTTELDDVTPAESVAIAVEAPDAEQLLVAWLDAVVFEMATRQFVFHRFDVAIQGDQLVGRAWGEQRDDARHTVGVEVKGPTFTELHVGKDDDGNWVAQCIVDV